MTNHLNPPGKKYVTVIFPALIAGTYAVFRTEVPPFLEPRMITLLQRGGTYANFVYINLRHLKPNVEIYRTVRYSSGV